MTPPVRVPGARHTRMRRIELVSGVAAGIVGLLGLATVLVGGVQRVPLGAVPFLIALLPAVLLGLAATAAAFARPPR